MLHKLAVALILVCISARGSAPSGNANAFSALIRDTVIELQMH